MGCSGEHVERSTSALPGPPLLLMIYSRLRTCMRSGTGILPVIHGLEAHATANRVSMHVLAPGRSASRPDEEQYPRCRDDKQERTMIRSRAKRGSSGSSVLRPPRFAAHRTQLLGTRKRKEAVQARMSVPCQSPGSGAFIPPVPSVGFPEAVHRRKEGRPAMGGTLRVSNRRQSRGRGPSRTSWLRPTMGGQKLFRPRRAAALRAMNRLRRTFRAPAASEASAAREGRRQLSPPLNRLFFSFLLPCGRSTEKPDEPLFLQPIPTTAPPATSSVRARSCRCGRLALFGAHSFGVPRLRGSDRSFPPEGGTPNGPRSPLYRKAAASCLLDELSDGTCCKSPDVKELENPQIAQILADSGTRTEREGHLRQSVGSSSYSWPSSLEICANRQKSADNWFWLRPEAALQSLCLWRRSSTIARVPGRSQRNPPKLWSLIYDLLFCCSVIIQVHQFLVK